MIRALVISGILIAATVAVVGSVLADKPQGDTRPGWGFGDKNHTHTGPPGHTTHPNK